MMGVSGVGKTTVGKLLAERLSVEFLEGDQFHPPANIAKMRNGEPLTDEDRLPWLEILASELAARRAAGKGVVLACSALRRRYRDILRDGHDDVDFVFLQADQHVIQQRIDARRGHFMPASLLESQLVALEHPGPDEHVITVDAAQPPEAIVETVLEQLGLLSSAPAREDPARR
jgi:carbohydrate kinase (thermoresistant glucokinase family)